MPLLFALFDWGPHPLVPNVDKDTMVAHSSKRRLATYLPACTGPLIERQPFRSSSGHTDFASPNVTSQVSVGKPLPPPLRLLVFRFETAAKATPAVRVLFQRRERLLCEHLR